ncbi:MAG: translocation/assembly module TamB domain-containing protein [Neisseriaceae bacterium]|nr:translocation/assembly module TamB domain-containing protein [Neisseriaceae bacterium]MBP6863097.1 translocation/assembly module TamB domain-containing protein [Neisseriaceae bacterium]
MSDPNKATAPNPSPTETETKQPKKRFKWLKRSLLAALLLLPLIAIGLYWLLTTNAGLRFAVFTAPKVASVNIEADTLNGSVWDGFSTKNMVVNTPDITVSIEHIEFKWQAKQLFQRLLHVNLLDVGVVHLDLHKTTPDKPSEPLVLPQNIGLPLGLQANIEAVRLAGLTMGKDKMVLLKSSEIAYRYQENGHELSLVALRTPWSSHTGELSLKNDAPYALKGNMAMTGSLDDIAIEGGLTFAGSLEQPLIKGGFSGEGVAATVDIDATPFAPELANKVNRITIAAGNINPQLFLSSIPAANLAFSLIVSPDASGNALDGQLTLANTQPNTPSQNGLPVQTILSQFNVNQNGVINVSALDLHALKEGRLSAQGVIDTAEKTLKTKLNISNLSIQDVIESSLKMTLNGELNLDGPLNAPETRWALRTDREVVSEGLLLLEQDQDQQTTLNIKEAFIKPKQGGSLDVAGTLALFGEKALNVSLTTTKFDPSKIMPELPQGDVNLSLTAKGALAVMGQDQKQAPEPDITVDLALQASRLSGAPLSGKSQLRYAQGHLPKIDALINLGNNHIQAKGAFGTDKDRLNLDIQAPNLDLFGFGLKGYVEAKGFVQGQPKNLTANLKGQARNLQVAKAISIRQLNVDTTVSPNMKAPLKIAISGDELAFLSEGKKSGTQIHNLNLAVNGTGNKHSLSAKANTNVDGKNYALDVAANGGLSDDYVWKGIVGKLNIQGAFNLLLQNPVSLTAGAEEVKLGQARWSAMGGSLSLQHLNWSKAKGISTKGQASRLALAQLANIVPIPVQQNLVIGGDWDLNYTENASGYLTLRHESGDVILPYRNQALELRDMVLKATLGRGQIALDAGLRTRFASAKANLSLAQNFGSNIMTAPLKGQLQLVADDLNQFRYLLPVGLQVRGRFNANVGVTGSISQPNLSGTLAGDALELRDFNSGLHFPDGTLRAHFSGQQLVLDQLRFNSPQGNITANGVIRNLNRSPDVNVNVLFDRYSLFSKSDRRVVISGNTKLRYADMVGIELVGNLKVDHGRIDLPESGAPSLSSDVVVKGRTQEAQGTPMPVNMDLTLDLNDRFRFVGQGLNVLMGGKINIRAKPKQPIQAIGQVIVVEGRYKAYGQDLEIDKGVVAFVGPIDNPALNIRAKRKMSPVGAGVEVTGNVLNPRINLIADTPMSQKDKLAWLVLGRAAGGEEDDAAIAASVGAALAGSINDRIGLFDDFGIANRTTRDSQGAMNPAEQMITVGKHLTNEIYVGYEYGLNSAENAVKLAYQFSKAWQAIVRLGQDSSSAETRYTIRFD